jgi:hypothetical protein
LSHLLLELGHLPL